jgi:type IV secretory pathway VirB3-like protein
MSFEDYMREKAAESRQKETAGFSLIVLGMVLLVGGLHITLVVVGNPDWFLFIPWKRTSDPTSLIGLSMTLCGFVFAFAGAAYIIFASSERSWYLSSLKATLEHTPKREEEMFKEKLQDLKRKIENLQDGAETE